MALLPGKDVERIIKAAIINIKLSHCGKLFREEGGGERLSDAGKEGPFYRHDLLVRNALGPVDIMANFLRDYLNCSWASRIDPDSLKREASESIGGDLSEVVGDLRYSGRLKATEREVKIFLFFEHQSRPDRFMSFRFLQYVCAAYQQHLSTAKKRKRTTFPYPLAVVLHHGKTPWKEVTPMRELIDVEPDMDAELLRLPIFLVDLAVMPVERLHGHPLVRAVLDSLQSESTGRLQERAPGIFSRMRSLRSDSRIKSWVSTLAHYYAYSVQGMVDDGTEDLRRVLTGLYSKREAGKMATTIAEKLLREGADKGRVEGIVKGIAEGKVESITKILDARFGKVPRSLAKKLAALHDGSRLDKAVIYAATCTSIKDFQKTL